MSDKSNQTNEEKEIDERCPYCRNRITPDEYVNAAMYDDEEGGGTICPHCNGKIPIDYDWEKR